MRVQSNIIQILQQTRVKLCNTIPQTQYALIDISVGDPLGSDDAQSLFTPKPGHRRQKQITVGTSMLALLSVFVDLYQRDRGFVERTVNGVAEELNTKFTPLSRSYVT